MNVLMISGSPWFQYKGTHSATYNTLQGTLRQGIDFHLVYPAAQPERELQNAREMMTVSPPGLTVTPIPMASRRGAKGLLSQVFKRTFFRRAWHRVILQDYVRQFASFAHLDPDLDPAFCSGIRSLLDGKTYDIIQVDYPHALKVVDIVGRYRIPTVFVTHEIQSVRAQRTFEARGRSHGSWVRAIREVEGHFLNKYDAVIALTATDARLMKELYDIDAYVSPHGIDTDYFAKRPARSGPPKLVFSGSENHCPNSDALRWCLNDIIPLLDRRLGDYVFYITGAWSESMKKAYTSPRVIFTGFVDDLRDYLAGAIAVSPIRIGSGMRVKILEAMAMGCGIVSTTIGCEGLGAVDKQHILTADTAQAFAEQVVALANDRALYDSLGRAARDLVVNGYSIDTTGVVRADVYRNILRKRPISGKGRQ